MISLVIHNSLQSFRHELLLSNFMGIPTLQQHGSADTNVPVFHSRRLKELISRSEDHSPHTYVELKGKEHWYDGIMTTPELRNFFDEVINKSDKFPELPEIFNIVVANPADMGSRGGLVVDQLVSPDRLGKVEVARKSSLWMLKTSNILRFHFDWESRPKAAAEDLIIDGCSISLTGQARLCWIVREPDGSWNVSVNVEIVGQVLLILNRHPRIVIGYFDKGIHHNWGPWMQSCAAKDTSLYCQRLKRPT